MQNLELFTQHGIQVPPTPAGQAALLHFLSDEYQSPKPSVSTRIHQLKQAQAGLIGRQAHCANGQIGTILCIVPLFPAQVIFIQFSTGEALGLNWEATIQTNDGQIVVPVEDLVKIVV